MEGTERFTSLADIEREKKRLEAKQAFHKERLRTHWGNFNAETRRSMTMRFVRDILPWKNGLWQEALVEGSRWAASSIAGRSSKGRNRFLWTGLSLVMPLLFRRLDPERMPHLMEELKVSFDRIRDRFAHRSNGS